MQELVLDKSFIDGSTAAVINSLCSKYDVLMTEELFFELMTTTREKRRNAFRKLPDRLNPVALIPNIGALLTFEKGAAKGCAPLLQHRIEVSYQFNRRLSEGTFVFEGSYAADLATLRDEIELDTRSFIDRCMVVHELFPELSGIKHSELPRAVAAARSSMAHDIERVRDIYRKLIADHPQELPPDPSAIDKQWAWFRWVQVQMTASLRIFARYQGKMPSNANAKFWTVAEHTMLDSYYVLFGTLCGGLASRDREIRDDFRLLCPQGLLLG